MVKNGNFIPKWGVNDHQMCCVNFLLFRKWSFIIMVFISKDIVLKHTPAKFELSIKMI